MQPGATQQGALQALTFPSARCHRSLCAPGACCKLNCGGIAPNGPPLAPPSGWHRSAQLPPAVLPQCWPQCPAGTGERPVGACSKQPAQQAMANWRVQQSVTSGPHRGHDARGALII